MVLVAVSAAKTLARAVRRRRGNRDSIDAAQPESDSLLPFNIITLERAYEALAGKKHEQFDADNIRDLLAGHFELSDTHAIDDICHALRKKNGQLRLCKFFAATCLYCQGTLGQKTRFLYGVFDEDQDDVLKHSELLKVIKAIVKAHIFMQTKLNHPRDLLSVAEYMKKIETFVLAGSMKMDGCMTWFEFLHTIEEHDEMLQLFYPPHWFIRRRDDQSHSLQLVRVPDSVLNRTPAERKWRAKLRQERLKQVGKDGPGSTKLTNRTLRSPMILSPNRSPQKENFKSSVVPEGKRYRDSFDPNAELAQKFGHLSLFSKLKEVDVASKVKEKFQVLVDMNRRKPNLRQGGSPSLSMSLPSNFRKSIAHESSLMPADQQPSVAKLEKLYLPLPSDSPPADNTNNTNNSSNKQPVLLPTPPLFTRSLPKHIHPMLVPYMPTTTVPNSFYSNGKRSSLTSQSSTVAAPVEEEELEDFAVLMQRAAPLPPPRFDPKKKHVDDLSDDPRFKSHYFVQASDEIMISCAVCGIKHGTDSCAARLVGGRAPTPISHNARARKPPVPSHHAAPRRPKTKQETGLTGQELYNNLAEYTRYVRIFRKTVPSPETYLDFEPFPVSNLLKKRFCGRPSTR